MAPGPYFRQRTGGGGSGGGTTDDDSTSDDNKSDNDNNSGGGGGGGSQTTADSFEQAGDGRLEAPGGPDTSTEPTDNNTSSSPPASNSDTTSRPGSATEPDSSPATPEGTGGGSGQDPTVVTDSGAPAADNTIVESRLNQAESYIEDEYGQLDRDDYQLRVTDTGNVEFAGLTDTGRRHAAERQGRVQAGLGIEEGPGGDITLPDAAGSDTLREDRAQERQTRAEDGLGFEEDASGNVSAPDAPGSDTFVEQDAGERQSRVEEGLGFEEDASGGVSAPDAEGSETLAERNVDERQFQQISNAQEESLQLDQDRTRSLVEDFENVTGLDVPGDGPIAEHRQVGEQFGDFDWSLGLGDPDEDEVEQSLDDFSQAVTDAGSDLGSDLFEDDGVASESLGQELLEAAGREDLGRAYEESLRDFGQGVVEGTAGLGAQVPQLATEVPEFAAYAVTNPGETADKLPAAVTASAVTASESAADNPSRFLGSLAGSAAATGGLFKATQGTRVGAASRVALQPGEELLKAGIKRSATASRVARATPGVSAGRTAGGTSSSPTLDTGVGGKLTDRVSSRIPDIKTRGFDTDESLTRQFLRDDRAQGQYPQGSRGGDSTSDTTTSTSEKTKEKVLDPEKEGVDIEERAREFTEERTEATDEFKRANVPARNRRPLETDEETGQLPPRDEFPSEEAYQRELARFRERDAETTGTTSETETSELMDEATSTGRAGRMDSVAAGFGLASGLDTIADSVAKTNERFDSLEAEAEFDPASGITVTASQFEESDLAAPAFDTTAEIDVTETVTETVDQFTTADTEIDTTVETRLDTTTAADTDLQKELDREVEQELGRELERELAAEKERESEMEAFLPDENDPMSETDADPGLFDEDVFDTGIADVEDLENKGF